MSYKRIAFERYDPISAYCGFGIPNLLDVAHIDQNRHNDDVDMRFR